MRYSLSILAAVLVQATAVAGPTCALLDPEKTPRVALLEAKLLTDAGTTWVERANIDAVLKEQKLQAMFSPQGVAERVKLGKLLKADVLVMVRPVKEAKEPTLEVVVSESAGGLRLLIRAVPVTKDADADVASLLAATRDGIRRHSEAVRLVVAVPPFVSQDLELTHDHLKGAFARLAEAEALDRKGVVVVELAEAEALAKEVALTDPGSKLDRPLPVYLLGEYRHEAKDGTISIKLRAERGGKLVGMPVELKSKSEEGAARVRKWSAETLDALAKDDKPQPPADPKAEAKLLMERAMTLKRLQSFQAASELIEAALLLNPGQPASHAEAIRVLHALMEQEELKALATEQGIEWLVRLVRRELAHVEAFYRTVGDTPRKLDVFDHVGDFLSSSSSLRYRGLKKGLLHARVQEYQKEEREVLLRLIPILTKQGQQEERRLVMHLTASLPPGERYKLLEEIILELNHLPDPVNRAVAYGWGAQLLDETPESKAFLSRLESSKEKNLQLAAAQLRQWIAEWKSRKRPPETGPGPSAVKLTPIALPVEETAPGSRPPSPFRGLLAVAPGIDIVWTLNALHVMKEKGKLRRLWRAPDLNIWVESVVTDGKYVWVVVTHLKGNPWVFVIDPVAEKSWDVSDSDAIPRATDKELGERSKRATILITGVEPGRVCMAGEFLKRAWVSTVTFDATTGKTTGKIIVEAKEVPDRTDPKQWASTRVGFTPDLLVTLTRPDGPDGKPSRRVIVGRSGGENFEIAYHPLVVDPDKQTVEVMGEKIGITPERTCVNGGSLLYFTAAPKGKDTFCGRIESLGMPKLTRETVADDMPTAPREECWIVVHNGVMHVAIQQPHKSVMIDGFRFESESVDWWTLKPDGTAKRHVASSVPDVVAVATSSHYGLVAWTLRIEPKARRVWTLNTVEIADALPKN